MDEDACGIGACAKGSYDLSVGLDDQWEFFVGARVDAHCKHFGFVGHLDWIEEERWKNLQQGVPPAIEDVSQSAVRKS